MSVCSWLRALVDDRGLRVAQVALDRVLVGVAVRAVDLDRVERALHRVVRAEPLGQARLARVAHAAVLEPRRLAAQQPARLDARAHLRDHLLDELVLADLLAEGLALVRVLDARVEARLGQADRARWRP